MLVIVAKAKGIADSVYRPPPALTWNYRMNFSLFQRHFIICYFGHLYLILSTLASNDLRLNSKLARDRALITVYVNSIKDTIHDVIEED